MSDQRIPCCCMCGFFEAIAGQLKQYTMHTLKGPVSRYRCVDQKGCERRQKDFPGMTR